MLWFKPKENIGLFIIHGFLGNPTTSYDDLPDILKKNRIKDVYLPQLQGHEYDGDINTFNYKECLRRIEDEYIIFRARHDKVYVMGFSMGGVIAGHLVNKFGADKAVFISPAYKYGGKGKVSSKVKSFLRANKAKKEEDIPDILDKKMKDEEAREIMTEFFEEVSSDTIDLVSDYGDKVENMKVSVFTNFLRLVNTVKKGLKEIDVPSRIYISDCDDIVPVDAAFYIFDRNKSTDKRLNVLTKVGHRIMVSELRQEVITEIVKFLYGKKRVKWPKTKKEKL